MHWLNSQLKSSLLALLGADAVTSTLREDRIEHIRQLMLDELGEFSHAHFPKIVRRIQYALDAEALWYLRGELMTVLGAMHGETLARKKIEQISQQFKGLLPKALMARSSSLKRE
ncbi:MAG: hypothetical protein JWR68_131 [Polaromonas sp.]|nr:hypothetical protein [Polaromonas sp.]